VIQRFCFVKLHDDEIATRGDLARLLSAQLREAGADAVVGLPADASAARWDLSIVITAASLAAWNTLAQIPAMIGAFDELARRATVVKEWTFESSDP
jgi:chemotaxis regulatin CheY-phosphate phosphatase CheZ